MVSAGGPKEYGRTTIKKRTVSLILAAFLAVPCFAVEDSTPKQVLGPFGTLNNADDPLVLGDNEAQDLLNVEITDQGKAVLKRKGLGLAFTLPISTSAVHGVYSFYDSAGNDVSLFFNDAYLSGSVNGAVITTIFSTGTVAATWDCTDSLGYAYCSSTARDPIIKTNGVTYTQLLPMTSIGTMVTATGERLVTAGFSGAPSQINFSGANDFTNWTLGGEASSPYNETINAPGSRITHIVAACNGLMWFKETSFGIILNPDDLQAAQNVILAPEIGTLDNTSVIYPGGLQFRAQDGHIYNYDCAGIEKLTRDITPTINTSGSRTSNSWTQTTKTDWDAGTGLLSGSFSTSLVSGDVVLSSFTATDTVAADFAQGTLTNTTTYAGVSVKISTNSTNLSNNSFEDTTGTITIWDGTENSPSIWSAVPSDTSGACAGSISGKVGTNFAMANPAQILSSAKLLVQILNSSDNSEITSSTVTMTSQSCTLSTSTISAPLASIGKRVQLKFTATDSSGGTTNAVLKTTNSFILGGDISFKTAVSVNSGVNAFPIIDWVTGGNDSIASGQFTSRTFDTNVSQAVVYTSATWTVATSTPYLEIQDSTDGSSFQKVTSSTGTNVTTNRYIRYLSSFTVGSSENALSTLDDVSFVAKSTGGVFLSAVHPTSAMSSWDTLDVTKNTDGGTQTFYVRASTTLFTVQQATPTWTSVSAGGIISGSTGTYMQFRDDFVTSYPTSTISLSEITMNWFQGSASDKAYGIYFGKDNALWWSVPVGAGQSTNNRILRYDLINRGWVLYDIPSNGFLIRNQNLYVGSANAGKIWKFGDTDSDEGAAIDSYWKSKDFSFDPTVEKEFTTLSVFVKSVSASSMTVTYTIDGSSSTSYTVPLYNANSTVMRNNRYLPAGRAGNTFNVEFGNNAADQYWELFGSVFGYKKRPWITEN